MTDHCLRSRHYVNVIVAGKQPALQWLDIDAAIHHAAAGLGIWEWASNDRGAEPDVVLGCCGDVPTLRDARRRRPAARYFPELKVRRERRRPVEAQPSSEHPHGLSDHEFDSLFTRTSRSSSRSTATRG